MFPVRLRFGHNAHFAMRPTQYSTRVATLHHARRSLDSQSTALPRSHRRRSRISRSVRASAPVFSSARSTSRHAQARAGTRTARQRALGGGLVVERRQRRRRDDGAVVGALVVGDAGGIVVVGDGGLVASLRLDGCGFLFEARLHRRAALVITRGLARHLFPREEQEPAGTRQDKSTWAIAKCV